MSKRRSPPVLADISLRSTLLLIRISSIFPRPPWVTESLQRALILEISEDKFCFFVKKLLAISIFLIFKASASSALKAVDSMSRVPEIGSTRIDILS